MKIIEAINRIDQQKPNGYSQADKIRWLSRLDGKIKAEIIDKHEGAVDTTFSEYTEEELYTELLVPHPYEEVYDLWLESQIDYANGETARYNNSISAFNYAYQVYERFYNREHMPKGNQFKFF